MAKINFYLLTMVNWCLSSRTCSTFLRFFQQQRFQTIHSKINSSQPKNFTLTNSNTLSCDHELIDWLRDILAFKWFTQLRTTIFKSLFPKWVVLLKNSESWLNTENHFWPRQLVWEWIKCSSGSKGLKSSCWGL